MHNEKKILMILCSRIIIKNAFMKKNWHKFVLLFKHTVGKKLESVINLIFSLLKRHIQAMTLLLESCIKKGKIKYMYVNVRESWRV